jgi:hypothetical protein
MPITPVVKLQFPTIELRSVLEKWWDSKTTSPLAPPKPQFEGTILDLQPEVTSQQAVIVLLDCEAVLGYQPSKKVIKRGGYISRAEFLQTLLSKLRAEWDAKHISKPPAPVSKETYAHAAAIGF